MSNMPEGFLEQAGFDATWRLAIAEHYEEGGPGGPIYFTTEAMRGFCHYALWKWRNGKMTEEEYVKKMTDMLEARSE